VDGPQPKIQIASGLRGSWGTLVASETARLLGEGFDRKSIAVVVDEQSFDLVRHAFGEARIPVPVYRIMEYRGREAEVVVVALLSQVDRSVRYVAMSRARSLLLIIATREALIGTSLDDEDKAWVMVVDTLARAAANTLTSDIASALPPPIWERVCALDASGIAAMFRRRC
jgi:hypothetical protein